MSLTLAYKYVTSELNREEVSILQESLSIFSPKYKPHENLMKEHPKRKSPRAFSKWKYEYNGPHFEDFESFKEDFDHFYHCVRSSRFDPEDYSKVYKFKIFEKDAKIMDHIITNYLATKKDELDTTQHEYRDKQDWVITIHRGCVERFLKEVKQINIVFGCHKIHRVDYD